MLEKEVNDDWAITNWHNCDLKKCLIRPKRRKILFGDGIKEVWIVLEEYPEDLDGSKIFFDEETKMFGLAMYSSPYSYACNSHDTFLAAFESM